MVDSFNTADPSPEVAPLDPQPKKGMGGYLATTTGRLVAGGVVVLLVAAAIAAIFFVFLIGRETDSATQGGFVQGSVEASQAPAGDETEVTERPVDALDNTFAFRNIFAPTVTITSSAGTSTDGSDDPADIPADTLFLIGVSTEDGEQIAELQWNGQIYSLSEGEEIPNSPWKVLSISGDTVIMLFGDSRVSLTAGQGITK